MKSFLTGVESTDVSPSLVRVKPISKTRDNIRTRRAVTLRPSKHGERIEMRTPRLFLGVIALALLLPLLLLACGGSDEPTDRPARATAEPTDMPDVIISGRAAPSHCDPANTGSESR